MRDCRSVAARRNGEREDDGAQLLRAAKREAMHAARPLFEHAGRRTR